MVWNVDVSTHQKANHWNCWVKGEKKLQVRVLEGTPTPARCRWTRFARTAGAPPRQPASLPASLAPAPGTTVPALGVRAETEQRAAESLCSARYTACAHRGLRATPPPGLPPQYPRGHGDAGTPPQTRRLYHKLHQRPEGARDPAIPPTPPHGSPHCRWRQWAPEGRSRAFGVHVCGRARARARPYAPLLYGNACTPPAPGAPYSTSPARRPTERADCHLPQHAQRLTSPGALSAADTPPRTASPVYQAAGLESDDNKLFARYVEVSKETHLYGKKGLFLYGKRGPFVWAGLESDDNKLSARFVLCVCVCACALCVCVRVRAVCVCVCVCVCV